MFVFAFALLLSAFKVFSRIFFRQQEVLDKKRWGIVFVRTAPYTVPLAASRRVLGCLVTEWFIISISFCSVFLFFLSRVLSFYLSFEYSSALSLCFYS